MFIKSVLTALFLISAAGYGVVISSECDGEFFAFYSGVRGGGSDDIGATGSWSKIYSNGWFRIGPFKTETMPDNYQYAVITRNGKTVSRMDSTDDTVSFACFHPSEGKQFEVDSSNGSSPVKDCLKEGGEWTPVERISKYGKYTLKVCDPSDQDPERTRHHWSDGEMHFMAMGSKTWHMVTSRDYVFREHFRDANAIILKRNAAPGDFIMLKKEGAYTKNQLTDANWSKLVDGSWIK